MTLIQVTALARASRPKKRTEEGTAADLVMFHNAKVG